MKTDLGIDAVAWNTNEQSGFRCRSFARAPDCPFGRVRVITLPGDERHPLSPYQIATLGRPAAEADRRGSTR